MKFLHKKSLGQNFLNNSHVPKQMAEAADLNSEDVVVEIGPGTGALTQELLERVARIIAIETDERAVLELKEKFPEEIHGGQLTLFHEDIKDFDLTNLNLLPRSFKVVANIPYFLSGFLFRKFLDTDVQPSMLVFLIQKEVAERIARSEKESLLSLSVKVFGDPKYITTVKRGNFTPQPKVDSAIIAVRDIGLHRLGGIDRLFFFSVLHEGFKAKRKQLLGNLSSMFDRETLTNTFSTTQIPLDVRAEDVSLEKWLKICSLLSNCS